MPSHFGRASLSPREAFHLTREVLHKGKSFESALVGSTIDLGTLSMLDRVTI